MNKRTQIKRTGFALMEVLVASALASTVIAGYLQMAWWMLRGQRLALYRQQACIMMFSLRENVAAENWIAQQIATKLPQGRIVSANGRWRIEWLGDHLTSEF